jgi:isocitrate/isopropylmalate dehydrogenase
MLAGFQGMAMWWFDKGKRREIWDEDIQWPIGDIDAAHRIREICRAADSSAERVASFAGRPDNKKHIYDTERYERAAKAAMEIAIKISDDLLRDSSVRQIVNLCMKANDLKTARILFRAIQAASIKQDVLVDHPALRQ